MSFPSHSPLPARVQPPAHRHPAGARRHLLEVLSRLNAVAAHSPHVFASPLGPFLQGGQTFHLSRFVFVGENAAEEAWRVAIYAGFDGTDSRASLAVVRALERFALEPHLGHSFNLVAHPLVNPSGFIDETTFSRSRQDLSKQHWARAHAPELQLLERDARAMQYHGLITVRTDPEVDELTGWLRGFSPGEPFLHAEPVKGHSKAGYLPFKFPIQWEPHPEGFTAQTGPLSLAEDLRQRPFEITLRVPAKPSLEWAAEAIGHTLRVFLNNFRTAAATGLNI